MIFESWFRKVGAVLVFGIAIPLALVAEFGDPRGFFDNESVTEELLYPGVKRYELIGLDGGRLQRIHIVRADISQPHLALRALGGDRQSFGTYYFAKSTVSQLHADNDAFVAINTDFFDIGGTQSPSGILVQDKMMLRQPDQNRNVLVVDDDGVPHIGKINATQRIWHNRTMRVFTGLNSAAIGANGMAVYQHPWKRSPARKAAFTKDFQITEVVLERTAFLAPGSQGGARLRGKVLEVRNNMDEVSIGPNQFVITGAGSARSFLQGMKVDSVVDVEWSLSMGRNRVLGYEISQAMGGGAVLIGEGRIQSMDTPHWNGRHPRSAIGLSEDGREVAIVMVEGRMAGRADGISLHRLAAFFQHLGARNALEFDGGGSSSIVARIDGQATRLNRPSDGGERYVPAGLGLMLVDEPVMPLFQDIRIAVEGSEAVISWTTAAPAVSFARYGPDTPDRASPVSAGAKRNHTAFLFDLEPGRNYARLYAELNSKTYQTPLFEIVPSEGGGVEIIVDDSEAVFVGSWSSGQSPVPWENSYRFAQTVSGVPTHTATFRPELPVAGLYDVFAWFTDGNNRANNARYEILPGDNQQRVVAVDQTSGGGRWQLLGTAVPFGRGDAGFVRLTNQAQTGKVVIADAVRWVLRKSDESEGVPVWWMNHFFGSDWPEVTEDADGDGTTVWQEYVRGTDPTDPDSVFRVDLEASGPVHRLTFSPFHENLKYELSRTSDLSDDAWEIFEGAVPVRLESGEGSFKVPVSAEEKRRFYRISVSR